MVNRGTYNRILYVRLVVELRKSFMASTGLDEDKLLRRYLDKNLYELVNM